MSQLVEITGVGARVKPIDSDRSRPRARGDRVMLSDEAAERMIGRGQAKLVDDQVADNAEVEQPDSGAIDLEELSVPELRRIADERRVNLHGARVKPDIIKAIEESAAMDDEDGDD
jgi:hypothetical protein